MNCVGIDVSKGKSMIAVMRPFGEVVLSPFEVQHTASELSELARTLKSLVGETRVVMEATGNYHTPVALTLQGTGLYVSVVNAMLVHDYGNNSLRRAKTDKKDAIKLANYGLDHWLTLPRYVPEEDTRMMLKNCYRQYQQYTLCMNIAAVYNKMGRYKEELDYQLQAISIMEKRFPQKHFSRITHYEGVADSYFVLGDYPHATEYYLKAVALLEELQPEDYRNIAIFYGKLGKSFSKVGNHPKALEYKSKVLKLRQKELPHLHPNMAVAYNNVAFTYAQLGDYKSALNHVRIAAEIARQTLPKDHQARRIYDKAVAKLEELIFLSDMGIDFPNPFV